MRVLLVLLLVGLLVSPVLACEKGGCGGTGSGKDGPAPGPDTGQVRVDPKTCPDGPLPTSEGKDQEADWAWYAVDAFGRRLSLAYEFRKECEPQVRTFASAGAVRCAWVRR